MHTDKLLIRSVVTGACAMGALAGCSSPPLPREQLAVGQASVESAQSAGANELAPVELNRAREKLAAAKAAARDRQMLVARRLAEEADADAQVARSRATAERSRKAAEEVTASLRTLHQQLDRASNDKLMPNPPAAGTNGTTPTPAPAQDNQDMDPGTPSSPPNGQPGTAPNSQ